MKKIHIVLTLVTRKLLISQIGMKLREDKVFKNIMFFAKRYFKGGEIRSFVLWATLFYRKPIKEIFIIDVENFLKGNKLTGFYIVVATFNLGIDASGNVDTH